jgi:alpha-1,2-mannosyltransferase
MPMSSKGALAERFDEMTSGRHRLGVRSVALILWVLAGLVAVLRVYPYLRNPTQAHLDDLDVYRNAVSAWGGHGSLYDFRQPNGDRFTYPPFAALILFPLEWLPRYLAYMLWTGAEVVAIGLMASLASRMARFQRGPSWLAPGLAILLAASAPAGSNLRFGQVSVFVALAGLAGLWVSDRRGGLLVGFATAMKLTPAVLIPALWMGSRRVSAKMAALVFLIAVVVSFCVAPWDSLRYWTREVLDSSRIINFETAGNQSLQAVLARLGVGGIAGSLVWVIVIGLLGVFILMRSGRLIDVGDPLAASVLLGAYTVIASPISWTHHQFLLVLGVLTYLPWSPALTWVWRGLVSWVMCIGFQSWMLPFHLGLYDLVVENGRFLLAIAMIILPLRSRDSGPPEGH